MEGSREALENFNAKVKVRSAQEYFEKSEDLALEYINGIVCPALQDVLKDLCLPIEKLHKVDDAEIEKNNFVIHYTSIAALVSMLQDASEEPERNDQEKEREDKKPEQEPTPDDKKSLWRLYDSMHLNDPDEGKYFTRNLKLPKKYNWLGEGDTTHAYITSFIIPDNKKDMSNNLVFWRTYGQEGEGCSLSLPVPRNRLQKVLYGAEAECAIKILRSNLVSLIGYLELLVKNCKQQLRKNIRSRLAGVVWESLERFRYLYKSEAYDYEKECRIVIAESDITDKNKIFFEEKNLNNSSIRIKHYYEHEDLEIKKLLATGSSTMLGPRVPYADNVCYFLNTLRQRAGLARQEIKISKIPYRKS